MRMNQCWGLCAAAAAAVAILDGGRGIVPFIAADSLVAVAVAISLAALWSRFDHEEKKLLRTAKAALTGGVLVTIANATITLMREADTVLLPQRLALGLTGLLYGAAIAGVMLAIADRRAATASPIKAPI